MRLFENQFEKMTETKAKEFALLAHKGQQYGTRDYSFHLEAVVGWAKKFNLNEEIIAACWLHDTAEDCGISIEEIRNLFGNAIGEMVFCVTDEPGKNRKERKEKTYPKIAGNADALAVKLCDRIANLNQSILDENAGLLSMYLKEHPDFKTKLFREDGPAFLNAIWNTLEELVAQGKTMQAK